MLHKVRKTTYVEEYSCYSNVPRNYRERKSILKKGVIFMYLFLNTLLLIIIAIELALIYVRLGEGKK